jgi:hypothetical protein
MVDAARRADFSDATSKLKSDIAQGKLSGRGYTFDGNQVSINSVKMTWHHDIKKGRMQLVTTELHEATQKNGLGGFKHIGMAYWWR